MRFRWIKTNWFFKKIFPNCIWKIPNQKNKIYLTFDDGPTPEITEWTLNQLKIHQAKATFFCIGNNIKKNPEVFKKVLKEGHSIGNHTFNHLNGWKTSNDNYFQNVALCEAEIRKHITEYCHLFRPPYGKIKLSQSQILRKKGYKIIMWDVISYDFDTTLSKEKCLENVIKNARSGSIIVFHDSVKAFPNLKYILPKTLEFFSKKGYVFEKIS
jgi:peptidoglycan/xylan/chitin deacetylase (PgdA/CDA1 family)